MKKLNKEPKSSLKPTKSEAIDILWRKGILIWKLNSAQRKMHDTFYNAKSRIPVFVAGRRSGKTRSLLILALEHCIKNPNTSVHYACPTAIMATKMVLPEMRKLLLDCPEDIRPKYYKHDKMFEFTNGSRIQIEGCDDGNADRLRGTATNLGIVDEAGFVKDLDYLVNDILLPQTITTNGRLLLSSTPPKSMAHPFVTFAQKAELAGSYIKLSVMDVLELIKNDPLPMQHINSEIIEEIKKEHGENSASWRREYMVEMITDQTYSVVPEFTDQLQKEIVLPWHRPAYYDAYTTMDPGLVDNTGVLFAYLDFTEARIVIEDEYLVSGNAVTTENIAASIKAKEHILWAREGIPSKVYMRISDNEPILLNDLAHLHGMNFIPTRKDDKEAAINDLRMKIAQKKIIINPRCVNLIFQLKSTTWNKRRTSFERTDKGSHGDLLDCLIYLVRNVHWYKNPFPNNGYNLDKQHVSGWNNRELTPSQEGVKAMFIRRRKTN